MLLLLALVAPVVARADGGIPQTLQIHFAADKPDSLYVVTNYGLLVSDDAGCTFRWICEQNVGYGSSAYIPQFAVGHDGTIYATGFAGLRISTDGGCSFAGAIGETFVTDVDIDEANAVWAVTGEAGRTNDVYLATDGATFVSANLSSNTIRWLSIKNAAGRTYVSGVDNTGAVQMRRKDNAGWNPVSIAGIATTMNAKLDIVAVDRANPDIVYVVATEHPDGDRLYRTTDGGSSWKLVFQLEGVITGVTLARLPGEGTDKVIVSTMVRKGLVLVGGPAMAASDGETFGPLDGAPTLACTTVAPDGRLFGCGANWEPDYMAVGRRDADGWKKVWRFVELLGPLDCGADSQQNMMCNSRYGNVEMTFQPTGPVCGEHIIPPPPDGPPPPPDHPGCGCDSGRPTSLIWVGLLFVISSRSARRSRRPRASR